MKIKDIEGILLKERPQATNWKDFDWQTEGFNHGIGACSDIEIEIDVEKVTKIISKEIPLYPRPDLIAQAISNAEGIIRVKK